MNNMRHLLWDDLTNTVSLAIPKRKSGAIDLIDYGPGQMWDALIAGIERPLTGGVDTPRYLLEDIR